MADITKLVKIVVEGSATGAQKSLSALDGTLTELNSKLSLVEKGFGYLSAAGAKLNSLIDSASGFQELSFAFDKLYGSADNLGKNGLNKLREATGGLIGDLDLLKKANAAAISGLPAEAFLNLAKAAETLGDSVQKDAKTALDDLTNALIKGGDKGLTDYGIKLRTTAEGGEKLAVVYEKIIARSKELGGNTDTAADRVTRLGNQWDITTRVFGQAFINSTELNNALDSVAQTLKNTDFTAYAEGLAKLVGLAITATEKFVSLGASLGQALKETFAPSVGAQLIGHLERTNQLIKERQDLLAKGDGTDRTREEIAELEKNRQKLVEMLKVRKEHIGAQVEESEAQKKSATTAEELRKKLVGLAKDSDGAAKKAKELADKWTDFTKQIEKNRLDKAIRVAIESGDTQGFERLRAQIESFTRQGLTDAFGNLVDPGVAQEAVNQVLEPLDEGFKESAEKLQKELEDKFQQSADFFADVFENAITGATFDLEDALKRLAIGFASSLAASISQSLGFDFGGVGGLQGLGGAIAGSLWQGLGGQAVGGTIGDLFKGIGGTGAGAAAGAWAGAGAAGLASGIATPAGVIAAGPVASGTAYGAYLGAAGAAGPPGWMIAAIVAAGSLLLPKIFDGVTKVFGKLFGGSQDPDELARRAFRKELSKTGLGEDLILPTVQGDVKLSQIDYKKFSQTFAGKDFGDQALGLVAPFSQVLTGGGKLGEDFALIFAQAVGNAKNYNEVIINTLSLMSKLGVSAGEAKDQFKELFLDGKVTLDQFTVGVQNLNFIAQEDLVGPNSVADAINALATAIENPRVQLKALELSFKEMAQLGIDTSSEIYAYLVDKWGPGVADVFKALTDAGIDTWQEIANASADQLVTIFNALKNLNVDIQGAMSRTAKTITSTFSDAGTQAASEFEKATDPVIKRIREIGEEAIKTGGIMDYVSSQISSNLKGVDTKLSDTKNNLGGITGTVPNNEFRA